MAKKAVKGFSQLSIFPVTANSATAYTVSTKVLVEGAVSMTLEPIVSEFKQYADDGIYNKGSDVTGYNFTLEIAEATPEVQELFEGGTYDETTGVYTFKTTDVQPENALSFRCLQADGNYKMVKLYSAVAQALSFNAKTKSESNDLQSIQIKGIVSARLIDAVLKDEKVSTAAGDLVWLDTIDTLPKV